MTAMNYEQWDVCNDACTLGQSLKLPIYIFVRIPLKGLTEKSFTKSWMKHLKDSNQKIKNIALK